jgi:hypothetical protein
MKHQRDVSPVKGAVMRGDATPFVDEEKVASSRAMAREGRSSSSSGTSTQSADALFLDTGMARSSQSRRELKRTSVFLSGHHDQPGGAVIR